jgi:hypothetical protein
VQASRDKDGFFVNNNRKDYKLFLEKNSEVSSPEEKSGSPDKEFVTKEGKMRRNHAVKGRSQHSKATPKHQDLPETSISSPEDERARVLSERGQRPGDKGQRLGPPSHQQGAAIFHSNLKRSFRYRNIALRKEYETPLFPTREVSDSEDEGDENVTSWVPESSGNPAPSNHHSNLVSIPDEVVISAVDLTTPGPHMKKDDMVVQRRHKHGSTAASQTTSMMSLAGYSSGNSYSKVTVTGPKRNSSSAVSGKRPILYVRSNSLSFKNQASIESDSPATTPQASDDNTLILPPPMFDGMDMIDLPSRPPSDNAMYSSRESLDQIIVDPPDMFSAKQPEPAVAEVASPKSKRKLSRTRKVASLTARARSNKRQGAAEKTSGTESQRSPTPKQGGNTPSSMLSNVVPDRDSTESSDTGYTSSSTSPGYTEGGHKLSKLRYPDKPDTVEDKGERQESNYLGGQGSTLKSIPSLNSLVSITSDTSRFYIPLVFHSPQVEGSGTNHDPNMFSVQVCLVENSDELIKVN